MCCNSSLEDLMIESNLLEFSLFRLLFRILKKFSVCIYILISLEALSKFDPSAFQWTDCVRSSADFP